MASKEERQVRLVATVANADPHTANAAALSALAAGAEGLALVFEDAAGEGLPATEQSIEAALAGIPFDRIHLRLEPHAASRATADALLALLTRRQTDPARLSLCFGIDPASVFAASGRLRMSIEALQASMPQSLAHFFAIGVPGVLLEADGRVFHNAGADPATEIGTVLAIAAAHLKLFEEARQALVYAAPHIGFALALTDDVDTSIAKVATLRRLWTRLQSHWRIDPRDAVIHTASSWRCRDVPGTDAAAARAAMRGGAFSFAPLGAVDSLRSSFASAGGAQPSDALANAAWDAFKTIESEGGIWASLADGRLQARIAAMGNDTQPLTPLARPEMAA